MVLTQAKSNPSLEKPGLGDIAPQSPSSRCRSGGGRVPPPAPPAQGSIGSHEKFGLLAFFR